MKIVNHNNKFKLLLYTFLTFYKQKKSTYHNIMQDTMQSIRDIFKNFNSIPTLEGKIVYNQKSIDLLTIVMKSDELSYREKINFFTEIEELKKSNDNMESKKKLNI